jgi:hypothetical protein
MKTFLGNTVVFYYLKNVFCIGKYCFIIEDSCVDYNGFYYLTFFNLQN